MNRHRRHSAHRPDGPRPPRPPTPFSQLPAEIQAIIGPSVVEYRARFGLPEDLDVIVIVSDPFPPGSVLVYVPDAFVRDDSAPPLDLSRDPP